MSNHLFDSLLSPSDSTNNSIFVYLPDGTELSYSEVWDRVTHYSHCLAGLGISSDDRVLVQVEKSIESIILYLACLRCGAIYIPLNPNYTDSEITYFLDDSLPKGGAGVNGTSVFICSPDRLSSLLAITQSRVLNTLTLEFFASELNKSDFPTITRSSDDLASIIYTSGTTGRSKGAMLSHENLLSNAKVLVETWRFTSKDILLHALPIFHVHGLFVAIHIVLLTKSSMRFLPKFSIESVLEHLPFSTTMMGVPTFYTRLLSSPNFTRAHTANMRLFISGSAPLSSQAHKSFYDLTGHSILERYGMSETSMITSNPYDGDRKAGSVGFPLSGISVRLCTDDGIEVKQGEVGVIEVKGPNVFNGYWNRDNYQDSDFRPDGFFITGDLSRIDESGYIEIVGRKKDLIISGGLNVYPKEIESVLGSHIYVLESAVIGVPHSDFGEAVIGIVVLSPDIQMDISSIESHLSSHCRDSLASFKCPKRILVLPSLPRNSMGKVEKHRLRSEYENLFSEQ